MQSALKMKALSASCYYYYYRAYCRYAEGKYSLKVAISHTHTEITWAMFIPGVNSMRPIEIYQGWTWFFFLFLSITQFLSNQVKVTLGPVSVKTCLSTKPLKHPENQVSMSSISPQVLSSFKSLPLKKTSFIFNLLHWRKCLKAVISHGKALQHWLSKSISHF